MDTYPHLQAPDVPLGDKPKINVCPWGADTQDAKQDLAAKYPLLGRGGSREVFDGGEVVYKVGVASANEYEVSSYENPDLAHGVPVAACRIVYHANGTQILIMETVRPIYDADELPEWSRQVDSHQVGVTRDGRVVCFDAGQPIKPADGYNSAPSISFMESHTLPAIFNGGEIAA